LLLLLLVAAEVSSWTYLGVLASSFDLVFIHQAHAINPIIDPINNNYHQQNDDLSSIVNFLGL
tara:strand:+ start:117 stop:305 length:189 start_codon:yes stop_codon:yes gene_type:complete